MTHRDPSLHPESASGFGFLVLGVPRSGTTFFAKIMNNHPDVICGNERFHAHGFSPDHLTETGFRTLDLDRLSAAQAQDHLDSKAGHASLVFGEKFPRAYLHFHKTLPRFEASDRPFKMIVLIRDIQEIANSWLRRATNGQDRHWPDGMYGVFPYIEQVLLAWQLSLLKRPEDVLLVSYARLFDPTTAPDVVDHIASHLELSNSEPLLSALKEGASVTRDSQHRDRSSDPVRFHSDDPFYSGFTDLVDSDGVVNLSDVQSDCGKLIETVRAEKTLLDAFSAHLSTETDPDIVSYQKSIVPLYEAVLGPLDQELNRHLKDAMMTPAEGETDNRDLISDDRIHNFDVTDTIRYLALKSSVTGIQRVQLDAVMAAAKLPSAATNRVVFMDAERGWIGLPLVRFASLLEEADNLLDGLRSVRADIEEQQPLAFGSDDTFLFLGATWSEPTILRSLSELHARNVRVVVYFHDILPVHIPEFFPPSHSGEFMQCIKTCLTFADAVLCNSEETKANLLEHTCFDGPVSVADLNIMPSFVEEFKALTPEQQSAPLGALGLADTDYVLVVGTLEPRKNHLTLLNAWFKVLRDLGGSCPRLVLVGKDGWKSTGIQETLGILEESGAALSLRDIDDATLAALYHGAKMTVTLSRVEGWNLPITESLALGTPCLSGSGSGARAAKQGLTIDVDELSERDVADVLVRYLSDASLLEQQRTRTQKAQFKTWGSFAEECIAFARRIPRRNAAFSFALGEAYSFGSAQNPRLKESKITGLQLLTGRGWNAPDSWGCWSSASAAELQLHDLPSGDYCVYAVVTTTPQRSGMNLNVTASDGAAWSGVLQSDRRSLIVLPFTKSDMTNSGKLTFTSDEPYDFGADDTLPDIRCLGFALVELRVVARDDFERRVATVESLVQHYQQ